MARVTEEKQHSIKQIEDRYPLDVALFGSLGAVAAHLYESLAGGFKGKRLRFLDDSEFAAIAHSGQVAEMNKIYWREILYRVYWASAINFVRHNQWQSACTSAFAEPANFLAFASGLRGLLEGAQDAWFSLGSVLPTLARDRSIIQLALAGEMDKRSFVAPELEDRLIHFVYARKLSKSERVAVPDSHSALEPKDYRNAIGLPDYAREMWTQLYDELCGFCHPTAFSLIPSWNEKDGVVEIVEPDGTSLILALCEKHKSTISTALSLGVTTAAMNLKALSWFNLPEVHCEEVSSWNFDDVPAWRKVQPSM